MFKNVLAGVDGRPGGRDAITLAARLADPDGELTLVHVHSGALRPVHTATPGLLAAEREDSPKLLARERAACGVRASLLSVASESPGAGLHRQAEVREADLLVVGSCGHGAFGRAMLGNDTRAALNGAPCAIAIASRGYADHPTPITKVGVGYDGSPESVAALALARRLALQNAASVSALEVVPVRSHARARSPGGARDGADAMLERAADRMRQLPDVEGHAVRGFSGEELARFSDEMDILVVGSRGYGPMRRLVLGSTSDYLERHARCALLVLPRGVEAGLPSLPA